MAARQPSFFNAELKRQTAWRDATAALSGAQRSSDRGPRFVADLASNLYPRLRTELPAYLAEKSIQPHRSAAHLLSSQTFCFNFLAPFRDEPDALAQLITPLVGSGAKPILLNGGPGYVAFEFVGGRDYLNESGGRALQRGANCTSVDAALAFERDGRRELLLIEWKYTESYGQRLPNTPRPNAKDGLADSNAVRSSRYRAIYDKGVIRPDLGLTLEQFYFEPFYQLLRQQMLAAEIEAAPESGFDRVTLAHVSPEGNAKLKLVTAKGMPEAVKDACADWSKLLSKPDRYVPLSVEELFGAFPTHAHPQLADWHAYMRERYAFLA